MTRSRIIKLLVAFVACALGLLVALGHLMVGEHEDWLERSYRNRWAFRDVPTKRGSILDREGVVVARDEPGFDLELRYREFRRAHVFGLAVHGANRLQRAFGYARTFRCDEPERMRDAVRVMLSLPIGLFGPSRQRVAREFEARRELDGRDVADLRFYTCSLLAELSEDVAPSRFFAALRRAVEDGEEGTIEELGRRVCRSEDAPFEPERWRRRMAELADCADRLGDLDASPERELDLFGFLESRRRAWEEWTEFVELPRRARVALRDPEFCAFAGLTSWRDFAAADEAQREGWLDGFAALDEAARESLAPGRALAAWNEDVPRTVRRRMPYADAVWVRLLQDEHAGFRLRPAVRRVRGSIPQRADLGSLDAAVGNVTPLWREDAEDAALRSWTRSLGELGLQEFLEGSEGVMPDRLRDTLRESATHAVFYHFLQYGRRGRGGIEQAVDALLAGAPGMRFVERDRRAEQRLFSTLDVQPGRDVNLTIDLELQGLLDEALAKSSIGEERAAVVLDATTGDILAISSWPNETEEGEPRWTLAALYPRSTPYIGSVVKPFVVLEQLAATRAGRPALPPHEFQDCRRSEEFRRTHLRCNCRGGGPAGRDPELALAHSCNWYLFDAVRGLGARGMRRALARFGLAAPSDADAMSVHGTPVLGFPNASIAGARLNPSGIPLAKQGIGYGVEANALFVARAYAGLATGAMPTLSFVQSVRRRPTVTLDVDAADLAVVRRGLAGCVAFGTARAEDWSTFGVVGKTGTAEVVPKAPKKNNAWFAGYAPPSRTGVQLAFAVVAYLVPDGSGGGRVAAPILHDFLLRVRDVPRLADAYLPEGVR